jgi:hypothetical protein
MTLTQDMNAIICIAGSKVSPESVLVGDGGKGANPNYYFMEQVQTN